MDAKDYRKVSFTLKGRIFHPALLTPKKQRKSDKEKFSVLFAWPIGDQAEQLKAIETHLRAGIQHFLAGIPKASLQLPIKTWGKYQKKDGSPNAEYLRDCKWMNISANKDFAPTVVDRWKNPVVDPVEIYSGRNALVNFSFFTYRNENFGISANLKAVMLLDGGEKQVGGVNIDQAFESFLGDTAGGDFAGETDSLV